MSLLRGTVTRLMHAPCRSSSVHRKIDMVLWHFLFHIPTTSMIYKLVTEWVFLRDDFIPKRYIFAGETQHKGAPTRAGVPRRGMPRQPPERSWHRVPKHICPNRKCGRGVENHPYVHPPAFVGGKLWNRGWNRPHASLAMT